MIRPVGTDCYELMTSATAYAEAHGAFNVTLNNKSAKKTITEHPELKGLVTCEWWLRETGAFCSIMGATLGNFYWEPGDVLMIFTIHAIWKARGSVRRSGSRSRHKGRSV